MRFIRERRLDVVDPAALGLHGLDTVPRNGHTVSAKQLVGILTSPDPAPAEHLLIATYLRGEPLPDLFDGPVREALERLGTMWKGGDVGIALEHRAVDLLIRTLNRIRGLQPEPRPHAPVAVGGAFAGDPYLLPSLMAATVLAETGYRVTNLGPDTPAPALLTAADNADADLVWLSVSIHVGETQLTEAIRALASRIAPVPLVLGGRGVEHQAALDVDGVELVPTMRDLSVFASAAVA